MAVTMIAVVAIAVVTIAVETIAVDWSPKCRLKKIYFPPYY